MKISIRQYTKITKHGYIGFIKVYEGKKYMYSKSTRIERPYTHEGLIDSFQDAEKLKLDEQWVLLKGGAII